MFHITVITFKSAEHLTFDVPWLSAEFPWNQFCISFVICMILLELNIVTGKSRWALRSTNGLQRNLCQHLPMMPSLCVIINEQLNYYSDWRTHSPARWVEALLNRDSIWYSLPFRYLFTMLVTHWLSYKYGEHTFHLLLISVRDLSIHSMIGILIFPSKKYTAISNSIYSGLSFWTKPVPCLNGVGLGPRLMTATATLVFFANYVIYIKTDWKQTNSLLSLMCDTLIHTRTHTCQCQIHQFKHVHSLITTIILLLKIMLTLFKPLIHF